MSIHLHIDRAGWTGCPQDGNTLGPADPGEHDSLRPGREPGRGRCGHSTGGEIPSTAAPTATQATARRAFVHGARPSRHEAAARQDAPPPDVAPAARDE